MIIFRTVKCKTQEPCGADLKCTGVDVENLQKAGQPDMIWFSIPKWGCGGVVT